MILRLGVSGSDRVDWASPFDGGTIFLALIETIWQ